MGTQTFPNGTWWLSSHLSWKVCPVQISESQFIGGSSSECSGRRGRWSSVDWILCPRIVVIKPKSEMGPVHLNLDPMDPVYCKWNGFNQKKKKMQCPTKSTKSKVKNCTTNFFHFTRWFQKNYEVAPKLLLITLTVWNMRWVLIQKFSPAQSKKETRFEQSRP